MDNVGLDLLILFVLCGCCGACFFDVVGTLVKAALGVGVVCLAVVLFVWVCKYPNAHRYNEKQDIDWIKKAGHIGETPDSRHRVYKLFGTKSYCLLDKQLLNADCYYESKDEIVESVRKASVNLGSPFGVKEKQNLERHICRIQDVP